MSQTSTLTQVKERPILFSTPMVQANLEGRKTQTRRTKGLEYINEQPGIWNLDESSPYLNEAGTHTYVDFYCGTDESSIVDVKCPYGKPGDQLWVRETFYAYGYWMLNEGSWTFIDMTLETDNISYRYYDNPPPEREIYTKKESGLGWYKRPSLFMPRAACRLLLEIVSVRVERLQDITEEDAIAEGVDSAVAGGFFKDYLHSWLTHCSARISFKSLWQSINRPESWQANPWVWVIEFKAIDKTKA